MVPPRVEKDLTAAGQILIVPLACGELATAHLVTETETAPALSTGILAYATPSIWCENMIFVADCRRRVAKPLKLRK